MTKISRKPVDPKNMGFYINNLWSAFTLMDNKDEIRLLFKDLHTHTEYKMLAKRLEIARRLLEGDTYESIMEHSKVTERTISNISNILERAGEGLRIAHRKLLLLEKDYQLRREEKQARLERRARRKLPAETFLADAILSGGGAILDTISKKVKKNSAKKLLSI